MRYKYEKIRDNGDATADYNVIGEYPVRFSDFLKEILTSEDSFRISFGASNESFGGWLGNRLEIYKDGKTKNCYWERQRPDNWYDAIKDLMITKCWASGGWGQILYIVTFDDKAVIT